MCSIVLLSYIGAMINNIQLLQADSVKYTTECSSTVCMHSSGAWCRLYVYTSVNIGTMPPLALYYCICVCTCKRSSRALDCLSIVNKIYDSMMTLTNLPHHPTIRTPLLCSIDSAALHSVGIAVTSMIRMSDEA
jgi:hypothetical protein